MLTLLFNDVVNKITFEPIPSHIPYQKKGGKLKQRLDRGGKLWWSTSQIGNMIDIGDMQKNLRNGAKTIS